MIVAIGLIAALNFPRSGANGSSGSALPQDLKRPTAEIPAGVARDDRTLGASTASLVLDAWEDFQCPACGQFSQVIEPDLISRFVTPGSMRIVYHDFAFLGQESFDAAAAARCAGDQGKFWDYHQWLFANQNGENQGWFTRDRLAAIADQVGLDRSTWDACYDGGARRQAVLDETGQGRAAGVSSTPTLMLDGQVLRFTTYDELLALIQAAIDKAGADSPVASAQPSPSASGAP